MALIPPDVIEHIFSYHPVRDPTFDNCVDQMKYFARLLEEYRSSQWRPTRSCYRKTSFHTFILCQIRMKKGTYNGKNSFPPMNINNTAI
jgi:hypothetical protein